jgi:hypothetical protein
MTPHLSFTVIDRYGSGDPLDEVTLWAVETHLEECADCRARLAGGTTRDSRSVIARVAGRLERDLVDEPMPAAHVRLWSTVRTRVLVGALQPWLTTTVIVLCCAAGLVSARAGYPSLVLLIAPLAPLPGVAIAWTRRADPAWELIGTTPGAGLPTLLRRTASVLVVVIPALAAMGAGTGVSLALALLPSLAFTAAALVLGTFVGVHRATIGLAVTWTSAVVAPWVLRTELPAVLQPGSTAGWVLTTVLLVALAFARVDSFRRLAHRF